VPSHPVFTLAGDAENCVLVRKMIVWLIKTKRMRWAGHVAGLEESRGEYRVLVGKPEGRRIFVRSRSRWDNNTKMDFKEIRQVSRLDRAGRG